MNPVLYQVFSKKFQLALRETLPCCRKWSSGHDDDLNASTVLPATTGRAGAGFAYQNHHHQHQHQHQNNTLGVIGSRQRGGGGGGTNQTSNSSFRSSSGSSPIRAHSSSAISASGGVSPQVTK